MPSAEPPRQESDATTTRDERTAGALPEVDDPARLPGLWRDRTFRFIWGGQTTPHQRRGLSRTLDDRG